MNYLDQGLEELESKKHRVHCDILEIFQYGRSPSDKEFLSLGEKAKELSNIEYAIGIITDLR
jgi:hypothetical protein